MKKRRRSILHILSAGAAIAASVGFFVVGVFLLWASTLTMPSLESVEQRKIEQSTKIFDRTGNILLYDLHQDVKRTVVPIMEISLSMQNATVAIEDSNFYNHLGIEPLAIVRAVIENLLSGDLLGGRGGSTITQQVVKNSLLVQDKKVSRKFKEWVLAIKLEQTLSKREILELYLNESPFGGNKYGVEEASQAFFGKPASELTLAESAYLAALPQAPTYYSPYGNNRDKLDERKNKVLREMLKHTFITEDEYEEALNEEITFRPQQTTGIKAPHFVFYVIEQLEREYGKQELEEGGFRVITTLDWDLQREAEKIVYRHAIENEEKFNAENASLMAVDPVTGDVLVMVGSRDYFDAEIDGNFNIGLATRQPGSAFKPFAYATALAKGYTPETIVFDVRTQFSTTCPYDNLTSEGDCYSPSNYDNMFRGPMTFRDALAQSVNVPAVKVVYLAGLKDTLETAQRLGISTLTDIARYGLTLVLGGGEVSLLEMTAAYGVFADDGVKSDTRPILRIENKDGETVHEFEEHQRPVLDREVARNITDMLADNTARTPAFGANSYLHFPGSDVAVKTGTTNDYRDAWIVGYTPTIAVGAWAGNNDNRSMEKKVAGFIIAPLWNEFMQYALTRGEEVTHFPAPETIPYSELKPILRGRWEGGESVIIDTASNKKATENTPKEFQKEVFIPNVHSILHWVNKDEPRGTYPEHPERDVQYRYWEYGVNLWSRTEDFLSDDNAPTIPQSNDDVHAPDNAPQVNIREPDAGDEYEARETVRARVSVDTVFDVERVDFFINNTLLGSDNDAPYEISFTPEDVVDIENENTFTVIVYDEYLNQGVNSVQFSVN